MSTLDQDDIDRSMVGRSPFDALYGLETTALREGFVEARLVADERHAQPTGVVHGGVYCAIAEATASNGTNWSVSPQGDVGLGMSNSTNFLRPAVVPTVLLARAVAQHRGRSTWVWDVTTTDETGDALFAISRMVIAVRPRRVTEAAPA